MQNGSQAKAGPAIAARLSLGKSRFAENNMSKKTDGVQFSLTTLIAVGNAGTGLALSDPPEGVNVQGEPFTASFRSFKAAGFEAVEVGNLHGDGKPCGLPEWDCALFVSHRGKPVRLMPLSAALKSGVVFAHKVLLRKDGSEREITVFAAKGWTPAQRQPKFLASMDVPAGRVESKLVQPDKRNASYVGHVLPLAMKRAAVTPNAAPAPVKPAKGEKSPAKGAKPTPAAPAPVKPA